ncbi:MAG: hypothetical protein WD689_07085 [Gaiellaceae bacterium]
MGTKHAFLAAAAAAAVLAGGCGGSEPAEPDRYVLAPTRDCLVELGRDVDTKRVDFVATTASGGAMRVTLDENFLVAAFGADPAEAERLELAYRQFAGKSIPIDDVLQRQKNVVLVWNAPPSAEHRDAVLGCLKGSE